MQDSGQVSDADTGGPSFFWSAGWFATVLSAYYIVRPVRDALGSMEGASRLRYFFAAVFLVMLLAVPAYGWLVTRFDRRRLVPVVYRFLELNLIGFSAALRLPEHIVARLVAPVFFVWVSVYVLFLTSLFWSVMADMFSRERGRAVFGRISGCGTAGAIAASLTTGVLASRVGPAFMLLGAAGLMETGLFCFRRLDRGRRTGPHGSAVQADRNDPVPSVGRSLFEGFAQIVSSPCLAGILLYTFTTVFCSTSLYMQQADMVRAAWPDAAARTEIFARLDLGTLLLTAALQLTAAGFVLRRSVSAALCLLPGIYVVGFPLIAMNPTISVLLATVVLSRSATYGFSVPAIGVLYTTVSRAEKYKAKSVIDTMVVRGGDALTSWTMTALRSSGIASASLLKIPVAAAVGGIVLGGFLGRRAARSRSTHSET